MQVLVPTNWEADWVWSCRANKKRTIFSNPLRRTNEQLKLFAEVRMCVCAYIHYCTCRGAQICTQMYTLCVSAHVPIYVCMYVCM